MTTIAYRDGIMAADGKRNDANDVKRGEVKKIHLFDDCIVGVSGDVPSITRFLDWVGSGMPQDNMPEMVSEKGFTATIVDAGGDVEIWQSDLTPMMQDAPFYASGSGYEIAMGAMAAGASAEEAVEIACEYDAHSGGPVQVVNVGGLKNANPS